MLCCLLTGVRCWLVSSLDIKRMDWPQFDYWTRQGEGPFFSFPCQHLCRLLSVLLAFVCKAHTKITARVKYPMFTIL